MKLLIALMASTLMSFAHAGALESSKKGSSCIQLDTQENLKIRWTAFRTDRRLPATLEFSNFTREGKNRGENLADLLVGQHVMITANEEGIESDDPGRNFNVAEFFFKLMKNPYSIHGKILKVGDGIADLEVRMNGKTRVVPMKAVHQGETLSLKGHIDVLDYALHPSLKKITEMCGVHEGKTWSDVEIVIEARTVPCS